MSSGSGSSDTGSTADKSESPTSPTPSTAHSTGSSNTVKRRPDTARTTTRPRHLKPKKEIYKNSNGNTKPAVCSKCEKCEDTEGEPVYQGILEVNTKQGEITEISSLKVRERGRVGGDQQGGGGIEIEM